MAKSIFLAQGYMRFLDGQTRYTFPVGSLGFYQGSGDNPTTVARAEILIRDAGVLNNAYCYADVNEIAADTVITLMKNGVATAITMTYGAGVTGVQTDTSNTVTVAAGDKIAWRLVMGAEAGANYIYITTLKLDFAPTTAANCVSILAMAGPGTTGVGTALTDLGADTCYWAPSGDVNQFDNTGDEVLAKYHSPFAFTSRNLYVYVVDNVRTTDTIIRTRINGVNGNQVITIPAGQSGGFEDTTNSDSIAVNDDFDYSITTSAAVETMDITVLSTTCVSTDRYFPIIMMELGANFTKVGADYSSLVGLILSDVFTTEPAAHLPVTFGLAVSHLMVYSAGNSLTGIETATITVRDSGADSELAVVYATTETGRKTDTGSVRISSGEAINYTVVNTGAPTHGVSISQFAILCQEMGVSWKRNL